MRSVSRLTWSSRNWIILFKAGLTIVVLWLVGKPLYAAFIGVDWRMVNPRGTTIFGGLLITGMSILIGAIIIRKLFRHLNASISLSQALVLHTIPQVGKYFPSKVFSVVGYMGIARAFGVGLKTSGSAALLAMGMGLTSATLLGVLLLLVRPSALPGMTPIQIAIICSSFVCMLVLIHPAVFWRIINLGLRIARRSPVVVQLGWKTMLYLFFELLLMNGMFLSGTCVVFYGLVTLNIKTLPILIGAYCLANVLGFLALFAPSGIGVREGVILLVLTPLIGAETAGFAAIILRFIQTALDVVMVLCGMVTWKIMKIRRKSTAAVPVSLQRSPINDNERTD